MKRLVLAFTLILLSINIIAQEWVGLDALSPTAPKITLLGDTGDEITLKIHIGGFYQTSVNTPQGTQKVITSPKMASILKEGAPDLPLLAVPILIDDLSEMDINIDKADYKDFEQISIAPSKGNLSRSINPDEIPFHYGNVYTQNRFFPEEQAALDTPYILRDCRGQNILVYPFAYNPVTKTLRVYTQMTLTMHKVGDNGINPKLRSRTWASRISPEADALYSHRFINYKGKAAKYAFIPDAGEMLVICPPAFLDAMQPFVDWKNQSGRPSTMVSLSDIGSNNDTQIKNYIQGVYNNPERNLTYVLLVGDYADIPPHTMNGGGSDIWFGQLEGNDYYPEIFVGRFSVGDVADVQNHVAKVLYYERDIPSSVTWLNHGIGIGSTEGSGSGHNGGESDYEHIDYIRDTLLHYTYNEVSQHYQGVGVGTNAAMLSENFNAGASICNYCNHGSTTGWYVGSFNSSHVNALTNDYKWPFIWSTACLNGQFYGDCFAEAWMRATNNATGAPTGAIGGMFSWTNQSWQPPMTGQDEMVDILCEWRSAEHYHHTLAGASLNGNMKILDLHPSDQGATHNTWILFGDPSLMLRTDNPSEMNVTCQPEAIFLGQTTLHVTADTDYATATLSVDGQVLCTVPIENGEATLVFPSPDETGTAQLVVMGFNKVTHVQDIQIIPANGPFLIYESHSVSDANGQADSGETCLLNMTIKNIGNEASSNIQVNLTTESPFITINDGSASIPSIEALSEYTIADGFEITVGEPITDGIMAGFTLTCSDGEHTWESHFRMKLHAPNLVLSEFRPISMAQPGIVDTLLIGIQNNGSSDAHQAQMQLFSSSSKLTISQNLFAIGEIPAGTTAMVMAPFFASQEVPSGSSFEVYYLIEASPYTLGNIELVNIGPIKETFETGDFSAFNWESLGGTHWFVDNSTSNTGSYSARSGAIGNANITTLQVEVDILQDGQISFYKKTSTEANKDKLTFYIDNNAKGEWSGEVGWSREAFPVTAGTHKFKWIYMKDSNGSYGDDACWIDDIQFPASNTTVFFPALELQVHVDLNEVTLTWESSNPNYNYIIRRNGEQIGVQHGTTFVDYPNLGTYTYSVVAYDDEQYSLPAFVTVTIDTVGTNEFHHDIQVFPNPVHNTLNISLGEAFNFNLYNCLGQLVRSGNSAGALQLQCRGLASGLYFLQIKTESHVETKRIVVQ